MLKKSLAILSSLLLAAGISVVAVATPASAAASTALSSSGKFTFVTEGNADFNSTSETEGSWAVGGNLTQSGNKYTLIAGAHQSTSDLPVVAGKSTRLLVAGSMTIGGGENQERLNVNPSDGYGNVTIGSSSPAYSITADGRIRNSAGAYAKTGNPSAAAATYPTDATAFSSYFGSDLFTDYRALSSSLTTLSGSNVATPTITQGPLNGTPLSNSNTFGIGLVANKINVWNVTTSQWNALQGGELKFYNGATPNAQTPLIINVPSSATSLDNPVFVGAPSNIAAVVLWNVTGSSFALTGSKLFSGSLLAPNAAFTFTKTTPAEGQFVTKTASIAGSGEIHHVAFIGETPEPASTSGSWTYHNADCDAPSNTLTVNAAEAVVYTWTAGPFTGTFTSYSGKDLAAGTYAFSVATTDGRPLTGATTFSNTFPSVPTKCGETTLECLPRSAVSYTYTPATNSGVITVTNPNPAKYSNDLCQGFWVTATSWKYVKSATWPQARDVVQKLPKITSVGTYPYVAAVTCGQGDIYASYAAQPDPSENLYGPSNPFAENFLHNMGFTGPSRTWVQQSSDCYIEEPSVSVVTAECSYNVDGTANFRSVEITFDNRKSTVDVYFEVEYFPEYNQTVKAGKSVTFNAANMWPGGGGYTIIAAGTTYGFPIAACDETDKPEPETRETSVPSYDCSTVVATITTTTFTTDWVFDTKTATWVKGSEVAGTPVVTTRPMTADEIAEAVCLTVVTDPEASTCAVTDKTDLTSWIRVELNANVEYTIDGTVVTEEFTAVTPGKHTVVANALNGYTLAGANPVPDDWTSKTHTWSFTAIDSSTCEPPTLTTVLPSYSSTPLTCTVAGTYTIGAAVGAVTWTVDGVVTSANTYTVTKPGTVTLVASTTNPKDKFDPKWVDEPKVLTFAYPAGGCDNPTLATVLPSYSSTPLTCTAAGSYTIGAEFGDVTWTVNGVVTPAGTYSVTEPGTVTLVATPTNSKDTFDETWVDGAKVVTFALPTSGCDNPTLATVLPEFSSTPLTCTTDGSYTMGAVFGDVSWTVNGIATAAGTYTMSTPGTVTLVATPTNSKDTFDATWVDGAKVLTFDYPSGGCENPTLATVLPKYSSTALSCTAAGSYTIGSEFGDVTWTVNGTPTAAGTYPVSAAGKVTLVATPTHAADTLDPEWVDKPIVLDFTLPDGACGTVLAMTGAVASFAAVWVAALLGLTGLGLVLVRRRIVSSK